MIPSAGREVGSLRIKIRLIACHSLGGLQPEIVQAVNAQDDAPQSHGQRQRGGICKVRLAIDDILVNLCLKSALYLCGRSIDGDRITSASDPCNS